MTPAHQELIAFIRARLDELERPARVVAAQYAEMRTQGFDPPWPRPAVRKAFAGSQDAAAAEAALALIEACGPEQVLADVEALRTMGNACARWLRAKPVTEADMALAAQADVVLRLIAYRWHAHPDYRATDWMPALGKTQTPTS